MKKTLVLAVLLFALSCVVRAADEAARNDGSGSSGGASTMIILDETTDEIFNIKGDSALRAMNVYVVGMSATGTPTWDNTEQECYDVGPAGTTTITPAISNATLFLIGIQDASGSLRIGFNGATASTHGFPIWDNTSISGDGILISSVTAYNVDTVSTETVCTVYGN